MNDKEIQSDEVEVGQVWEHKIIKTKVDVVGTGKTIMFFQVAFKTRDEGFLAINSLEDFLAKFERVL